MGRIVRLTDDGWAHVLAEHHQMAGRIDEVWNTVSYADEVLRDRAILHRDVPYTVIVPDRLLLRIVVHYRPSPVEGRSGAVVTAHFISRRYRTEAPLWP